MAIIIHTEKGKGYRVRYHYPAFVRVTTSGNTVKQIPVRDLRIMDRGSEGFELNKEISNCLDDGEQIVKIETIDAYGKVLEEHVAPEGTLIIPEE